MIRKFGLDILENVVGFVHRGAIFQDEHGQFLEWVVLRRERCAVPWDLGDQFKRDAFLSKDDTDFPGIWLY